MRHSRGAGSSLVRATSSSVHGSSEPMARLRAPRFRRLMPFEDPEETPTFNIIVMEVQLEDWFDPLTGGCVILLTLRFLPQPRPLNARPPPTPSN